MIKNDIEFLYEDNNYDTFKFSDQGLFLTRQNENESELIASEQYIAKYILDIRTILAEAGLRKDSPYYRLLITRVYISNKYDLFLEVENGEPDGFLSHNILFIPIEKYREALSRLNKKIEEKKLEKSSK